MIVVGRSTPIPPAGGLRALVESLHIAFCCWPTKLATSDPAELGIEQVVVESLVSSATAWDATVSSLSLRSRCSAVVSRSFLS